MIDRRPGLIIRCASAADVVPSLHFVKEHQLLLAVRGGGHNIAGNAVCDGGVVLDLSLMKSVRVDPERRIARVEAGCTLGDVDHDRQVFGLAPPSASTPRPAWQGSRWAAGSAGSHANTG